MSRQCLVLDLKDDPQLIARYRAWHAPGGPPAAVIAAIRRAGVEAMQIYLSGNRLVLVMDTGPGIDPEARARSDAADPEVQAWEALMSQFQQPVPWAAPGAKWTPALRIFDLAEQA